MLMHFFFSIVLLPSAFNGWYSLGSFRGLLFFSLHTASYPIRSYKSMGSYLGLCTEVRMERLPHLLGDDAWVPCTYARHNISKGDPLFFPQTHSSFRPNLASWLYYCPLSCPSFLNQVVEEHKLVFNLVKTQVLGLGYLGLVPSSPFLICSVIYKLVNISV